MVDYGVVILSLSFIYIDYSLLFLGFSAGDTIGPGQSPAAHSDAENDPVGIPYEAPATESEGLMGAGTRERILSLDRAGFIRYFQTNLHGQEIADVLLSSRRNSTRNQQEVAWRAFQSWLREDDARGLTKTDLLKFCLFLRNVKKLSPRTISNYRASLSQPLRFVCNLNFDDSEFKELDKAFQLSKPPPLKRIPQWNITKVLNLLKTDKFDVSSCDLLCLLKKTLFLVALSSGNRVSELSAIYISASRSSVDGSLCLPVDGSFRFKNQRADRAPPDIEIKRLDEDPALCQVCSVLAFKERLDLSVGRLFVNSKTKRPLNASSLAYLICQLIEEADPGNFPRAHDVRKAAASLAWVRGVPMDEIVRKCFWKGNSVFINTYLYQVTT